ncbi:hypothetical protein D3C85_242680 [compost metagenome]
MDAVRAAVGHVQFLAVTARVQAVRTHARLDETDFLQGSAIDDVHAVGVHVGDKEFLAVWRDAYVLRHAFLDAADFIRRAAYRTGLGKALGRHLQFQVAVDLAAHQVDLGDGAVELAGEHGVAAVIGKVGMVDAAALGRVDRILHGHGLRIAEIEAVARFCHDDGGLAIRRVIHIVGIIDGHFLARLARQRVDRRQAALVRALGIVRHPQGTQVPRRHDVLRTAADLELVDHFQAVLVDHVDVVRAQIGHVNPAQVIFDDGAHIAAGDAAVHVFRIDQRRHARQRRIRGGRR